MTMHDLPSVPSAELPIRELRAPLKIPDGASPTDSAEQASLPDVRALCDLLEPAISAAIARKARQRRYTP